MFGLGMGEIVVILVVALLVLGPNQLPEAAKQIGKAIRQLRRHTKDLQDTIEQDEAIGGTMRELKSALRGDDLYDGLRPRIRGAPPGEAPVAQAAPAAIPAATPDAPAAVAAPDPTAEKPVETAAAAPEKTSEHG